jgi:hypothetical protein
MNRRDFLVLGATAGLDRAIHASTTCNPLACRSEVNLAAFAVTAYQAQQCPEWCWAACISMIFAFQGHPVAQTRIVKEVYGNVVCFPSGNAMTIASQLSREWQDDNGNSFTSRIVAAFDAQAGVHAIDNATIIRELDSGNPLIICNTHHAMVLTAIDYRPTPQGPYVLGVGVVDPWPGYGAHALSPAEFIMAPVGQCMFVAAVDVEDAS